MSLINIQSNNTFYEPPIGSLIKKKEFVISYESKQFGSLAFMNLWKGSIEEYNDISIKDPDTLYLII